jgi:hypothetical protein
MKKLYRKLENGMNGKMVRTLKIFDLFVVLYGVKGIMVFNTTFNNILVISWRSVLLVEETWENHQPVASHW